MRDGGAVLLDANRTTGRATYGEHVQLATQRRTQAAGIHFYLHGGTPL